MANIVRSLSSLSRQNKKNNFDARKRSFGQNDDRSLKDTLRGVRNKSQLTSKRFHLPREPEVPENFGLPPPTVITPFESPDLVESRSEDSDSSRSGAVFVSGKYDGVICRRKSKLNSQSVPTEIEHQPMITRQEINKGSKKVIFAETNDVDELYASADTDDGSSTTSSIDITMEEFQHEVAIMCSYESYLSVKHAFIGFLERFIEKKAQ
jgi:hypothetical protein